MRPPDRGGHREYIAVELNVSTGAVRVARDVATGPASTHVQLKSDRPRLRIAGAGVCKKRRLRAAIEDLSRVENPVDGSLAVKHDVHRQIHAPRRDGDGDGKVSWVFVLVQHEAGPAALVFIRRAGLRGSERWVRWWGWGRGWRWRIGLAGWRPRRLWRRRRGRWRSGVTCDLGLLVDARRRKPEAVVLVPRSSQFERGVASAGPEEVSTVRLLDHWRRERPPVEHEGRAFLPIANHNFELEPRAPLPGYLESHSQIALPGSDGSGLHAIPTAKVACHAAAKVAVISLVPFRAKGVALRRRRIAGAIAWATCKRVCRACENDEWHTTEHTLRACEGVTARDRGGRCGMVTFW